MRVNEVFQSIQGEGINAGLPTIFIRLAGCNLYPDNCCSYCDTRYAQRDKGRRLLPKSIVDEIKKLSGYHRVCITGGEPLFQSGDLFDLVDRLNFNDYYVEIFTNATLKYPTWGGLVDSWIADIKCPSSGVHSLAEEWITKLLPRDQLKFTVATPEDLVYASNVMFDKHHAQVVVSPVIPNCPNAQFGEVLMANRVWLQTVWNFCITNNCRYSLQLHKIVFGNKKGV